MQLSLKATVQSIVIEWAINDPQSHTIRNTRDISDFPNLEIILTKEWDKGRSSAGAPNFMRPNLETINPFRRHTYIES